MSSQVINNKKYQLVQNVFGDLQEMIDRHGFDLLEDDNLKSFIQNCYEKFKLKMDTKITVGAIFDPRTNNSSLIDTLVKEQITNCLKSDAPYLVKGDDKSKKIHLDEDLKDIKTISVPSDRWKVFENSLLLLSSKNYNGFIKMLKEVHDPDVVVLVVNSPTDLRKDDIKSFLSKTGKRYNNGNFFLVLNDAKDIDCASVNHCDVCYPKDIKTFLNETGIEFEDKSFKVSTSNYNEGNEAKSYLDENLEKLKECLEVELNIDTVVQGFYKDAQKIRCSMTDLKKSFDEKKVKESINQMNCKLEEHSPKIKTSIDDFEKNTIRELEKVLKENFKNYNMDIRDLMRLFFNEKLNEFDNNLKSKLDIILENDDNKEDHRKFKNIIHDMFFNQNLKKNETMENVNKFLNTDVMKYKMTEIKKEKEEEIKSPDTSIWKRIIGGTKVVVTKICNKAKDAYDGLVKTFKETTEKLLKEMNDTMKNTLNLLVNDFMKDIRENCQILTTITEDEKENMLNNLNQSMNSIEASIRKKDQVNIYDNTIGNYISNEISNLSAVCHVSFIIDKLYSKMISFEYNNEFCDIYRNKFCSSDLIKSFDNSCQREISRFEELINQNRFYDYQSDSVNIVASVAAGVTSGVITGGIFGFGLFSPVTAVMGGVVGASIGIAEGLIRNQPQNRRKFIKTYTILENVNECKTKLRTLILEVTRDIINGINEYLKFIGNLNNFQN